MQLVIVVVGVFLTAAVLGQTLDLLDQLQARKRRKK